MSSKPVLQTQANQLFLKRLSTVFGVSSGILMVAGSILPWVKDSTLPTGIENGGLPIVYLVLGVTSIIVTASLYFTNGKAPQVFMILLLEAVYRRGE